MEKRKKLTLLEVFGLSIAMVAPTGAMSFNTASAAANAGINMPIAFLLGGIGVLFVAISFVELGKRIPGDVRHMLTMPKRLAKRPALFPAGCWC